MKPEFQVALAFVISLLWIQPSFCDGPSENLNKWICRCSFQGNRSSSLANCSASCDCRLDAKESASSRTCLCDPHGFPNVEADGHSSNCFTACNCTWGALGISQGSKKHISGKIAIVILLLCVICTTVAFLASIICYVWQRDKCAIQTPIFSSDNETSYNSTAILISNRTSVPVVTNSPINLISGCFQTASFLCGNKRETFHGNIIQFSFAILEKATKSFSASNLIEQGRNSYVYRGQLKSGTNVAVKRLKAQEGTQADTE